MNFGRSKTILLAALFALVLSASAFADIRCTPSRTTAMAILNASQNDAGGFGNFATTYDNWNINPGGIYNVNEVQFTGGYFKVDPGSITGWTVNVYFDNGSGPPGTLQHTTHISGNGGETSLAATSTPMTLPALASRNSPAFEYWLSVVPDLTSRRSGAGRPAPAVMEPPTRTTSATAARWEPIRLSRSRHRRSRAGNAGHAGNGRARIGWRHPPQAVLRLKQANIKAAFGRLF